MQEYTRPALTVYGRVTDFTHGAGGSSPDGQAGHNDQLGGGNDDNPKPPLG